MAARKRGKDPEPKRSVDPALTAFADFMQSEKEKERQQKAEQRAERKREKEARRLVDAKDEAAAELKRIRSRGGATAQEREEAEAAYRRALAAVVTEETGRPPDWAPQDDAEAESEDAPTPESEARPDGDPDQQPDADAARPEPEASSEDESPVPASD